MSNFFPQEFIEQVRSANDIVSVIGEYVSLKKKGRNYFGLCPFHAEKTPSFSVNAEKQIFHCFGCGEGGNVVSFLMTHDKLGFVEAIKLLARRANIRLPQKEYDRKNLELLDRLYYANQMAASYFIWNLNRSAEGKIALKYLDKRKVSKDAIKEFQLGLATDEWDGLIRFCTSKGVETDTLLAAGLIIERSDRKGYYDRFKNRLVFPIFNLSSKMVAFAGRILDEKDSPKYMNSPETPIYQKGKLLYGLNFSKEKIRESQKAIIVEGYFDFLSLYQNGIQNIVASCGTAFTPDQARLLSRFAEEAILLFDSDGAGQRAVLRSVDLLYDAGLEVKVAVLPAGYDPDKYINTHGSEKLKELIFKSISYVKFKTGLLEDKFSKLNLNEQEKVLLDFTRTGLKINDGVKRELFLKQVADQLGIGEEIIRKAVQKVIGSSKGKEVSNAPLPQKTGPVWEREFLGLVLNMPEMIEKFKPNLPTENFSGALHQQAWELFQAEYKRKQKLELSEIMGGVSSVSLRNLLIELAGQEFPTAEAETIFREYLQRFNLLEREKELANIKENLKKAEESKDTERIKNLSQKLQNLLKESRLTSS